MFEQTFKNIDDALHKEAGCASELDYAEQSSWLLFLKYLDCLEQGKAMEAELEGKNYTFLLDEPYRWASWAAPKGADGKLDHNKALAGDDLRDFVDRKLFPYLHGFKQKASGPNTIEYKIGEIFGEIKNKIHSGYILRDVIDHVDELSFGSQVEKHELSHLYEAKIKNMGNAGHNGGEYYTPRPLIRAIVQVVKPEIGQRIYDGAVGSASFLCEAFDYLKYRPNLTTSDLQTLQESTFYGKEKKVAGLRHCHHEYGPAWHPRLPRRHLPGGGGQDCGPLLREECTDAQGLVLLAGCWPQHGQDQPAQ